MIFQRNLNFKQDQKMIHDLLFSNMLVCCALFCALTVVSDWIFMLSCHCIVVLLFFFVVLPVLFYTDVTLLHFSVSPALSSLILQSDGPVWL